MQLLAQGTDIRELLSCESFIPEGGRILVLADLSGPISQEHLNGVFQEIEKPGVVVRGVYESLEGTPTLIVDAEKHMGPLLFIVGAMLALPVIVFAWRLFLIPPEKVFAMIVVPGLITVAGLVAFALWLYKPSKKKVAAAAVTKRLK
jgi:hypothetical protein